MLCSEFLHMLFGLLHHSNSVKLSQFNISVLLYMIYTFIHSLIFSYLFMADFYDKNEHVRLTSIFFCFYDYSQPLLSRLILSQITAYLEEKIWSLF